MRAYCTFVTGVLLLALSPHRATADEPRFIPLGFFSNGNFASAATAVSDQAPYTVVGWGNTQAQSRIAFRWTEAGGMQPIGTAFSMADDVSADGSVVVGSNLGSGGTAWRWTSANPVKSSLGTGGVSGVSADGSVVVGSSADRGWRWTQADGRVTLPLLPGALSNYNPASGVSSDGRYVVGQGRAATGYRAYRYDATTATIIALDASVANPTDSGRAITTDGQVVAGSAHSKMGRWINGSLVNAASNSTGTYMGQSMTGDGETIVGTALVSALIDEAFIWDEEHGIRELKQAMSADYALADEMAGWTFRSAVDISADGNAIVGHGINPAGFSEGFLIALPEPSAGLLLGAVAAGLLRRFRRAS